MTKPKRLTWEEFQEMHVYIEGPSIEWQAFHANEKYIDWLEKGKELLQREVVARGNKIAELEYICDNVDIEISVFQKNKQQKETIAKLTEALGFYASRENWDVDCVGTTNRYVDYTLKERSGGDIARTALSELRCENDI